MHVYKRQVFARIINQQIQPKNNHIHLKLYPSDTSLLEPTRILSSNA